MFHHFILVVQQDRHDLIIAAQRIEMNAVQAQEVELLPEVGDYGSVAFKVKLQQVMSLLVWSSC